MEVDHVYVFAPLAVNVVVTGVSEQKDVWPVMVKVGAAELVTEMVLVPVLLWLTERLLFFIFTTKEAV